MNEEDWLEHVEEGLRDLLEDLNVEGYTTKGSCSGHLLVTGEITKGWIELAPHSVTNNKDVEAVAEIVRRHTSVPFTIRRGRYNRITFGGSLTTKPTTSDATAEDILAILEGRITGGLGRGKQKLSKMYDVDALRSAARRFRKRLTALQLRLDS